MNISKLKPVVNSPQTWEILDEYLTYLYATKHKELENQENLNELYRAQGYIRAIKELRALKDRLNVD